MTTEQKTDQLLAEETTESSSSSINPAFQQRDLMGYLGVTLRGACMGGADVIPGVSGGTMALILGIYHELIASIRAFDLDALKLLFSAKFRELNRHLNLSFLLFLFVGIASAIITLAKIIPQLLQKYPAPVHGFFFGLILASIFLVWKSIEEHSWITLTFLVVGAIAAYLLVGMIPVSTPNSLTFIFFSGFFAIMAMILPGISGAFILLILGKYAYILDALHHVVHTRRFDHEFTVVVVFIAGCAVGLLSFARFLNWLLKRYPSQTLALLAGFMIGSLRRIWLFQEYTRQTFGKKSLVVAYKNFWPSAHQWTSEYWLAVILVFVGVLLVFTLNWFAQKRTTA